MASDSSDGRLLFCVRVLLRYQKLSCAAFDFGCCRKLPFSRPSSPRPLPPRSLLSRPLTFFANPVLKSRKLLQIIETNTESPPNSEAVALPTALLASWTVNVAQTLVQRRMINGWTGSALSESTEKLQGSHVRLRNTISVKSAEIFTSNELQVSTYPEKYSPL